MPEQFAGKRCLAVPAKLAEGCVSGLMTAHHRIVLDGEKTRTTVVQQRWVSAMQCNSMRCERIRCKDKDELWCLGRKKLVVVLTVNSELGPGAAILRTDAGAASPRLQQAQSRRQHRVGAQVILRLHASHAAALLTRPLSHVLRMPRAQLNAPVLPYEDSPS